MIDSFKELLVEQVKDLYHAEKQLTTALPRITMSAHSRDLKHALERHVKETRDHVGRLEKVFQLIGEEPAERKCRGMAGLIAEADEVVSDCSSPAVRDAAIIASAQRIQHYEMAGYGAARTFAQMLGLDDAARMLQQSLDEEGGIHHVLTSLARSSINQQAVHA